MNCTHIYSYMNCTHIYSYTHTYTQIYYIASCCIKQGDLAHQQNPGEFVHLQ